MNHSLSLLGPVFALAAWTIGVLLLVAFRRLSAGRSGAVHPREFALGESSKVPAPAVLANRNYMNLLELPVLFYVACLVAIVAGATTAAMLALAWCYVALRMVHSIIHITYNRIAHRFAVFALSNAVLIALWVALGLQVFTVGRAA
jgi:hypothetical protein